MTLAAAVERACRALEAEQPPDLNTLAEQAGMSRFHFHRIFKAATGITPKAYANALRADRARQQLRQSASVTDAMYSASFNSSGRFYETAPAIPCHRVVRTDGSLAGYRWGIERKRELIEREAKAA